MLKKYVFPLLVLALLGPVIGCNSSSEDEYEYVQSSSVLVSGFYLTNDKKVLDSLSNVFFSIDLVNAKIFNADSLPYGTNVSRLVPKITVASTASAVTLTYYEPSTQRDSVVNYISNSTDSINFVAGPVTLTVTSQNGSVKRDYQIKVNVHQVKSDTLAWYQMQSAELPATFATVKHQASAMYNNVCYLLSSDGTNYSLASTADLDNPQWTSKALTFDFTPDIESMRCSNNAIYMLDDKGNMYKSADFESWTATGENWHYILGGYDDQIMGTRLDGDTYSIVSYPSGKKWQAPVDFPVENTSLPTFYLLPMGYSTQTVMLGGRCADGTLSASAWGFDGEEWTCLSTKPLNVALEDVTLVPYSMMEMTSSTWSPKSFPVLMAFGGRTASGAVNRTVYYSRDWGMTWKVGPSTVQLPAEVPPFYKANGFMYTSTMHVASRSGAWTDLNVGRLPGTARFCMPEISRAIAPVTEWQCPALYLLGGHSPDGAVYNTLWRGVILQYTFVPVQ